MAKVNCRISKNSKIGKKPNRATMLTLTLASPCSEYFNCFDNKELIGSGALISGVHCAHRSSMGIAEHDKSVKVAKNDSFTRNAKSRVIDEICCGKMFEEGYYAQDAFLSLF
ncbi:hypothetical protein D918_01001 [Trichuris suis]|nr:hypothetical protein D918_01001 [Trichuris suis]